MVMSLGALAVALTVFVAAAHNAWTALVVLFAAGASGSWLPAIQIQSRRVCNSLSVAWSGAPRR